MSQEGRSVRLFAVGETKDGEPSPVPPVNYKEIGAEERPDIQRWIKSDPTILGEELMIVAEELSSWTKGSDRPDLIAIDQTGKLVVVEIKRDKTAPSPDLQAIRYASYVSTLTSAQVVELYCDFERKEHGKEVSASRGRKVLSDFTSDALEDLDEDEQPRMILAASGFRPEVMSTVLWARKLGLDIGCVQIEPFRVKGEIVLASTTLVPLPEAKEYEIGLQAKQQAASAKRKHQPLDRKAVFDFIASIPTGHWTSYGDVAAAAGNPKAPVALGGMLRNSAEGEFPNVYRVLNSNGEVNQGWKGESDDLPDTPEDVEALLIEEGVSFVDGKASQSDRWNAEAWEAQKMDPAEVDEFG